MQNGGGSVLGCGRLRHVAVLVALGTNFAPLPFSTRAVLSVVQRPQGVTSFCLQRPAAGWIQSVAGLHGAPPLLHIAARGLPLNTGLGIFVDEGTARSAYEVAYVHTHAVTRVTTSVRAFIGLPRRVRRLLIESLHGTTTQIIAVARPCPRARQCQGRPSQRC